MPCSFAGYNLPLPLLFPANASKHKIETQHVFKPRRNRNAGSETKSTTSNTTSFRKKTNHARGESDDGQSHKPSHIASPW